MNVAARSTSRESLPLTAAALWAFMRLVMLRRCRARRGHQRKSSRDWAQLLNAFRAVLTFMYRERSPSLPVALKPLRV